MNTELAKLAQVVGLWGAVASIWYLAFFGDVLGEQARSRARLMELEEAVRLARRAQGIVEQFLPSGQARVIAFDYIPVIQAAARSSGVQVNNLTPLPPTTRGVGGTVGISFSLEGGYPGVARFVAELERGVIPDPTTGTSGPGKTVAGRASQRLVRVADLTLSRRDGTSGRLFGSARVDVFLR
ncbi:MAG: hypothetical protein HY815_16005 [Candidatus Riflebacteria bacterium]|nr:hypothetical protein [Candidatus Riflebacteria bacterium]